MNERIDLTKILKYCPEGTKFYSPVWGEVSFERILDIEVYTIEIDTASGSQHLTKEGCYVNREDAECIFFPSKDQRDWNKFVAHWYKKEPEPKFKVGDWVVNKFGDSWHIVNLDKKNYQVSDEKGNYNYFPISKQDEMHLWTIQDAKDGDIICYRDEISLYKNEIENCNKQDTTFGGFVYYCCYDSKRFITNSFYFLTGQDEIDIYPATKEQRDLLFQKIKEAGYKWNVKTKTLDKLVKPKFDQKTLKPFDKVLCKVAYGRWHCDFFSCYVEGYKYPNICISGSYSYCIPYNDDTKHLIGTYEEAPEYYRYWEN